MMKSKVPSVHSEARHIKDKILKLNRRSILLPGTTTDDLANLKWKYQGIIFLGN